MTDTNDKAAQGNNHGRLVKLGFAVLAVVIVAVVYCSHRTLSPPKGWIDNKLDEAVQQARDENRNLLVLFVSEPPSAMDRKLRDGTLSKKANIDAVREGNFVAVMVRVSRDGREGLFEEYDIKALPTTVIVSPDGHEIARREGFIGETNFRNLFLAEARGR
jgi:thioredoxin-related protein